ncbi:enoyl-CoA hydratase-related protein [Nocardia gamkensis]|uniref:enoyl-CoA hydratase-related protein n=1 Tax=Nocardia gamkensis TaxID=352869 RepID=UPI0034048965
MLTVNRPEARNAINLAAAQAIEAAVDEFEADEAARVLVLTGAGGTFSDGPPVAKHLGAHSPRVAKHQGWAASWGPLPRSSPHGSGGWPDECRGDYLADAASGLSVRAERGSAVCGRRVSSRRRPGFPEWSRRRGRPGPSRAGRA